MEDRMKRGKPLVVIGLCSGTHDSAAALISDGVLAGLAEEERFTGAKHTAAYPQESIGWLLGRAGLSPWQVTDVAYNFDPVRYLAAVPASVASLANPATTRRALPRACSFTCVYRNARGRVRGFRARFPGAAVHGTEHHLAHGLYAFTASGFDAAAILIADSLGETATTTISSARRSGAGISYRRLQTIRDPASLGYAYGAITQHLGWRRGDEEGTVMALAALGDPARFRPLLQGAITITSTGFALDPRLFPLRVLSGRWPRISPAFTAASCPPRPPGGEIEQVHSDLAAALQERTEEVLLHLARRAREQTGARVLCVGGGVAMNCVAAGRIAAEAGFDQIAVPPAPADSGTAAGAAIARYHNLTGDIPAGVSDTCYLGPDYPAVTLDEHPRPGLSATRVQQPARLLAEQLASGQIIGLFQGRLEAGPRALGNRSILASPLRREIADRLNATVKYREPFRPFAPVVLADQAARYFTLAQPSPFMSLASGVTPRARVEIPAVVHVNGTARVQTVTPGQNPFLAAVLTAFAEITGTPVLINTSLNIKGMPICGTPDQALDCLMASGLDALVIEHWWVSKGPGLPPEPRGSA
jgi:carbamoyltransferase